MAILSNFIAHIGMYTSLNLICLAPSMDLSMSASVTLMVYDMAQPHRVAFNQLNVIRPDEPIIVSLSPQVVPMNVATVLSVIVEKYLRWESCDLSALLH